MKSKPLEIETRCCGPFRNPRTQRDGNVEYSQIVVRYYNDSEEVIFTGERFRTKDWIEQGGAR